MVAIAALRPVPVRTSAPGPGVCEVARGALETFLVNVEGRAIARPAEHTA